MSKYKYEIVKTNVVAERYTITSTDKLSIDEIEELVREEFVFVGQSNKYDLEHITTETKYIGNDDVLSEESIAVVKGAGDVNHEEN